MATTQRPAAVIAATYRRDPTGDWIVPAVVDPDDPTVRLLLLTPDGPLLIDLSIRIDGDGFRRHHELAINEALAEQDSSDAKTPRPSPESDSTPTPDELSARTFQPDDTLARLRKYALQSSSPISREEARWLLAQWLPGPDLLELHARFAADRAQRAPLWTALDADTDGILAQSELTSIRARLHDLDANEDGLVDVSELTTTPVIDSWTSFPLLTVLSDATDWPALARQLRELPSHSSKTVAPLRARFLQRLEVNQSSDLNANSLSQLCKGPPDMNLQVMFATNDTTEAGLLLVDVADGCLPAADALATSDDALSFRLTGCIVEMAGAQPPVVTRSVWNGQVAVGAVLDGDPLLRMVDADNDRRLSLREVDAVMQVAARLDRDHDGDVTIDELPVPIRLVVTLGPYAHRVLAQPTAMSHPLRHHDRPDAPDWFAGMDRNKDGELTIAEFLGTRDQFDQFDTNRNQRISIAEAVKTNHSEN